VSGILEVKIHVSPEDAQRLLDILNPRPQDQDLYWYIKLAREQAIMHSVDAIDGIDVEGNREFLSGDPYVTPAEQGS